ncbi:hypothetical protein, partial [Pilimelia terevasa]|uniref:hypothetical protein n=1 Tax=Pilimelia terevasa TaxID=53372 RepID=UPI00166D1C7C
QLYRRAIDAGRQDALGGLASLLSEQGRVEEAEQLYRRAIDAGDLQATAKLNDLLSGRRAWRYVNSAGDPYYLNANQVRLRGGKVQTIYYFSRDIRSDSLDSPPAGYFVTENERTGLPFLKKAN